MSDELMIDVFHNLLELINKLFVKLFLDMSRFKDKRV